MTKKICVVTGTRAEYGLLKNLMREIDEDGELCLRIVATGAHLSECFGNTYKEILSGGFCIHENIEILMGSGSVSMAQAQALAKFSDYFEEYPCDLVVVLGDRYEILAAALAAYNNHIPIAHIHGGETTAGALDEAYRHMITKMASLHFPAAKEYARRIIQLGEDPKTVFCTGAPCIDAICALEEAPIEEIEAKIGAKLKKKFAVVTFHPATTEDNTFEAQAKALISALAARSDMDFIITKSNADTGGERINELVDEACAKHENLNCVFSLGQRLYYSALKKCEMVIGNSSSGIIEAPFFRVPTVNIGDRQKGRFMCGSVINCAPTESDILSAIKKAGEMSGSIADMESPYGEPGVARRILDVIKASLEAGIDLKKTFYDIEEKK